MLFRPPFYAPVLLLVAPAWAGEAESLYDRGQRLYSEGKFESAEQVLREAAGKHPRSIPVRFLLGSTLLRLNRNAEAIRELKLANQLNPAHRDAAKLLARQYLADRSAGLAIEVLLALMRYAEPDEETLQLLIKAYTARGEPGDAEAASRLADVARERFSKQSTRKSGKK